MRIRAPYCAGMISYKLTAFNERLTRVEETPPVPAGSEVLVRICASGVCHSDLHIAQGSFDLGGGERLDLLGGIALPRTLGHEIAGEAIAAGPAADVVLGKHYLVYPWIGEGSCAMCSAGNEHLCSRPRALGAGADGGYSDHVLVPHSRYLVDYGKLPEALAATYACSGLTAYSALRKAGPLGPGENILIVGAGGVGGAAIRLAGALYGIAPVVADIDPRKRASALEAGASDAVDPSDPSARATLAKAAGGFAAVLDFVGAESSAQFGLSLVRKGGRLIVVGLFGGALRVALPLLPLRGIAIVGSYVGSLRELRELVALANAENAPAIPIESRPLDQAQAALDALRAGAVAGRIVLAP
ncbi:MAG: alcohol dehydrogenase [Candidatus Velthaea sp.]